MTILKMLVAVHQTLSAMPIANKVPQMYIIFPAYFVINLDFFTRERLQENKNWSD